MHLAGTNFSGFANPSTYPGGGGGGGGGGQMFQLPPQTKDFVDVFVDNSPNALTLFL